MEKMSFPPAVVVSIAAVSDQKPTPFSSRLVIVCRRCGRFRPSRSSRHTTRVSPNPPRARTAGTVDRNSS